MAKIKPDKAVIAWTPSHASTADHPTRGKVEVRDRAPDLNEHWTDRYFCSGGAITSWDVRDAVAEPKTYAYRWFVYLTTEYNMDPKIVAAELSKIEGFSKRGLDQ